MKRVLVIEDDIDVRENICELLELNDYEVDSAMNGQEGIKKALRKKSDLILCDITMPLMDGYEVLEILRQHPETYNVPFMFLTARSEKLDIRKGMNLGADDYITKPYSIKDLLNSIKSRIEKSEGIKQHFDEQMEELRKNISLSLPHEFRTPLNIILGFTQLLKMNRPGMDDEEIENILDSIEEGGKRLLKMVENYTLLNKLITLENNKQKIQNDSAFSELIINDIATQLAYKNNRKEDLVINLEERKIFISPKYLDIIIRQIIENAIKFSVPGNKIEITSNISDGIYYISLYNEGRGMTPHEIENIGAFSQFGRNEFEQQGSGIGLEIVKRICNLYGGTLEIESEKGLYIVFRLGFRILE